MPRVVFMAFDGRRFPVDAPAGQSLMQAAIDHGVPGIDADCGGQCACATCHVFIAPPWSVLTGACTAAEDEMLNASAERQSASRLACQVQLTEAMDGLEVRLPEAQH